MKWFVNQPILSWSDSSTGCCPNTFFAYLLCAPWVRVFCINLRLTSGNDKTRFQLKQLSLLIFRYALTGSSQHLRSAIISIFLTGKATGLQLWNKTLSMAAQRDIVWATTRTSWRNYLFRITEGFSGIILYKFSLPLYAFSQFRIILGAFGR